MFQIIALIFLIRASKTAGNLAGDFSEVAFWVLKSRCPEGGNLNVEQVNVHLDNIALKHAAHDPSKIHIFIKKKCNQSPATKMIVLWVVVMCSLVEVSEVLTHHPNDGGSKDL
jgi:DNA ligase-4